MASPEDARPTDERLAPGVPGLTQVLDGGFLPERAYLLRGPPGTGKTILGTQFLAAAGADDALLVSLGQSGEDLRRDADDGDVVDRFEAGEPGEYHLFCAEYCGTSHAEMYAKVIAVDRGEFNQWLQTGGGNEDRPAVVQGFTHNLPTVLTPARRRRSPARPCRQARRPPGRRSPAPLRRGGPPG